MPRNIIDGIDLDSGEIVEGFVPKANGDLVVQEVDEPQGAKAREERIDVISTLFSDKQWHFDTDTTGFIIYQITNWHSGVVCPISVKFTFTEKQLHVSNFVGKKKSIKLSDVKEMGNYMKEYKLARPIVWREHKKIYAKYRATHNFQIGAYNLAQKAGAILQHKIYQAVMLSKHDIMMYTRLDAKVLVGESLIEKVVDRGPRHVITEKGGERILYVYQSLLEEKPVEEIITLI